MNVAVSLVVPCFKVARFLPDFLASLSTQIADPSRVEVVFVIDGSPDESEAIVRDWCRSSSMRANVIVTSNQGVSAARNAGMQVCHGSWVTFPDPDDTLDDNYLERVLKVIDQRDEVNLIATRLSMFLDSTGESKSHPLDYRYNSGSRAVDLRQDPTFLQLAVHTAVFRTEVIQQNNLTFDSRVKVFEDGKFVAEYLLALEHPSLYLDVDAKYNYRKREDASSALSLSDQDLVKRYRASISYAHLELLSSTQGHTPRWLENYVLYDLYWLFAPFMSIRNAVHGSPQTELDELAALSTSILEKIDPATIYAFNIVRVLPEVRAAWIVRSTGSIPEIWVTRYRLDTSRQLREYRYFASSTDFIGTVEITGKIVTPAFDKWRKILFFGRPWLYERILWIPEDGPPKFRASRIAEQAGEQFANNGIPRTYPEHVVHFGWRPPRAEDRNEISRTFRERAAASWQRAKPYLGHGLAILLGKLPNWRDTWVFIDRDTQAGDNAEALYEFVRSHRPEINAKFVVSRSSPDYKRLRKGDRNVIRHRSLSHFLAMRNAHALISSQIDQYIVNPFPKMRLRKRWIFVFLQHGVTQNALHRWLNTKDVQLLITATRGEYQAFVESPGLYIFGENDVYLTGFPRHDSLFRKAALVPETRKKWLLIMPTWRQYLSSNPNNYQGNTRQMRVDFAASEFVQNWQELLQDPRLMEVCEVQGLEPAILPHPNLESHFKELVIPAKIKKFSYLEDDIQELLANTKVAITDYSSQAFEAAFCGAPTIYFQFDRETFYQGGHIGSPGYFDFHEDGLGPVANSASTAIDMLTLIASGTHPSQSEYQKRIDLLYPFHDDRASERVFDQIKSRLG